MSIDSQDLSDLSITLNREDGLQHSRAKRLISRLDLKQFDHLTPSETRYAGLLTRRHAITEELARYGVHPPLLYERAWTYDVLGYADLAAADAFVVYAVCDAVVSDEWISDLEPVELDGESWPSEENAINNHYVLFDALVLLCKSLIKLGATEDANERFNELIERYETTFGWDGHREDLIVVIRKLLTDDSLENHPAMPPIDTKSSSVSKTGYSRREIYPWNTHEPDRNAVESIIELNAMLSNAAPNIEAKVTALPALSEDGSSSEEMWYQLGLFATKDLPPKEVILAEDSLLTAIRPLDDALCDACGADLELLSRDKMRQCPGQDCDTTFCSEICANRAAQEYHKPNLSTETEIDTSDDNVTNHDDDEDDAAVSESDYPPAHAPFCANTALYEIGRTSSTTTAEWDLYFLLLTRTIQISLTQDLHPLSLPSTKYLWGDFNPVPNPDPHSHAKATHNLPWSLYHNISLPLQYFETLMHSSPEMRPYSPSWLRRYDWWIQTTLLAKFRGVANAQQSTFDGKAEMAAVHPLWCLANHSCRPNVTWTPTGTRIFTVRDGLDGDVDGDGTGRGIRKGEEIWSHYTDVRLPVKERRARLMEVLGGVCRCPRCLSEAGEEGKGSESSPSPSSSMLSLSSRKNGK